VGVVPHAEVQNFPSRSPLEHLAGGLIKIREGEAGGLAVTVQQGHEALGVSKIHESIDYE
jgi:hypothetical protein